MLRSQARLSGAVQQHCGICPCLNLLGGQLCNRLYLTPTSGLTDARLASMYAKYKNIVSSGHPSVNLMADRWSNAPGHGCRLLCGWGCASGQMRGWCAAWPHQACRKPNTVDEHASAPAVGCYLNSQPYASFHAQLSLLLAPAVPTPCSASKTHTCYCLLSTSLSTVLLGQL